MNENGGVSVAEIEKEQQLTLERFAVYFSELYGRIEVLEKNNKEKHIIIEALRKQIK